MKIFTCLQCNEIMENCFRSAVNMHICDGCHIKNNQDICSGCSYQEELFDGIYDLEFEEPLCQDCSHEYLSEFNAHHAG